MNRKISKLLQPGVEMYFIILILFALASALFSLPLAVLEAVVVLILGLYTRTSGHKRRREITKYIENITGNVDVATKDTMVNSPLPMVIFRPESDDIIWTNDRFLRLTGDREHLFDAKLSSVVPGFDTRWLLEGKNECPNHITFCGRRFIVYGHLVRTSDKGSGFLATTYWVDVTELCDIQDRYQASRPVMAVLLLDNYEDLMKNLTENERSAIYSEINARLDAWVADTHGMLRRVERDRYYYIFEEQYLARFIEKKFDILDTIRQVSNPSGIAATLSIGVGKDGSSFQELMQFANLSIEMALSRGGDQAVIKDRYNFTFYGGRTKETERHTRVKSRVVAGSLSELIAQSSEVFIMGHRMADLDALGAAVGVRCLCRKRGKPAHIVIDLKNNMAGSLIDELRQNADYEDVFISGQDALVEADPRSLLIVVDTNRPDQVESKELLESIPRVAVIDHHRRAADYIEQVVLNLHEPFASSASELVAELLQYAVDPKDITPLEAQALLAGIVLDTKNFTVRTGSRTFEAAAFLRRAGADTVEVKKLFQTDLDDTLTRYRVVQAARLYRGELAIACLDETITRTIAAQAADELINISGITASFVLFPDGEQVIISARSIGSCNVQVVLEKLGGGGNAATAGAQIRDKSVREVLTELVASIDQFYES